MNVRTPATVLVVALIAGACGLTGEVNTAAGEAASADPPMETHASHDGSWGATLEEMAAELELTVLVRATDNAWTEAPPGHPPKDEWSEEDKPLLDRMSYQWREFEVVEVLSGSYDYETLNYGNHLERTRAGETYLLLVSVIRDSSGEQDPQYWPPLYSDQHFTGPAPPYLLTADNILTSTDPAVWPELDAALTLSDARARLGDGDTGSQDGRTDPLEAAPTPLPSLNEEE